MKYHKKSKIAFQTEAPKAVYKTKNFKSIFASHAGKLIYCLTTGNNLPQKVVKFQYFKKNLSNLLIFSQNNFTNKFLPKVIDKK
jgi:hypothetical protein